MSSYSDAYDQTLSSVLAIEGGHVDDPADSGGATNYGITEALAREYGYDGPMKHFPRRKAQEIYHEHFWKWMRLQKIHNWAPQTAHELFDAGVNIGRRRVWRWLQRALNALNRNERLYSDIATDGYPGPETLTALHDFLTARPDDGDRVLAAILNSLQAHHYVTLAEARKKDERFLFGWIRQRVIEE